MSIDPDETRRLEKSSSHEADPREVRAGTEPTSADDWSLVGRRVGRVRVDSPIAVGGMGAVYRGVDETLERRVALKAIRPEFSFSEATKERFLREARILSRLDHPNICRLFDLVETTEGDVLILELVEGRTLKELPPGIGPDLAERLRITRDVSLALASAHREGIVHRDLKPENVMLRPDGVVKVLDFGIARSADPSPAPRPYDENAPTLVTDPDEVAPTRTTSGSELTVRGSILGTLRFMSPEQAVGDPATAASDVFSLGLVIQWLWTGRHAYDPSLSQLALIKKIRWAETLPLESGDSDLDELVERCKSLDPRDRPTADEVAERLAWIADRPARIRRRWRLAAAATGIALVTVIGSLGLSRSYRDRQVGLCRGGETRLAEVWSPERGRAVEASFSATGLAFAGSTFDLVTEGVSGWTREWTEMRRDACEATHVRGEQSTELLDLRMACLDRRLGELDALLAVFERADPAVLERAPTAIAELGELSHCADREALTTPVPRPADPEVAAELAAVDALLARGDALLDAGKHAEALEIGHEAVERADAVDYRPLQAEALHLRGSAEEWVGEFEASRITLQKAIEAAVAGLHDEALVRALADLVWVVGNDQADLDAARPWAGLAFAKLERMNPRGELAAVVHNNFGSALMVAGAWDEARQQLERALEIRSRVYGEDHLKVAAVLGNLANLAYAEGRHEEAVELNRRAIAIYETQLGPEHPRLGLVLGNLGSALQQQGKLDECAEVNQRAYEITLAAYGAGNPNLGFLLVNLGQVALSRGDRPGAMERFRRADDLFAKTFPADHPVFAMSQSGIGATLLASGRAFEAIGPLERALAVNPPEAAIPTERAATQFALVRAYWEAGQRARARTVLEEARETLAAVPGSRLLSEIESWMAERGLS